jgi:hypothetical protein
LLTSVAPTGTISLFADNVSSGLEPVFSFIYSRNVMMPDGSRREEEVSDYAYRLFRRAFGEKMPLPDYFIDAQGLGPNDHLVMQAAVMGMHIVVVVADVAEIASVVEHADLERAVPQHGGGHRIGILRGANLARGTACGMTLAWWACPAVNGGV